MPFSDDLNSLQIKTRLFELIAEDDDFVNLENVCNIFFNYENLEFSGEEASVVLKCFLKNAGYLIFDKYSDNFKKIMANHNDLPLKLQGELLYTAIVFARIGFVDFFLDRGYRLIEDKQQWCKIIYNIKKKVIKGEIYNKILTSLCKAIDNDEVKLLDNPLQSIIVLLVSNYIKPESYADVSALLTRLNKKWCKDRDFLSPLLNITNEICKTLPQDEYLDENISNFIKCILSIECKVDVLNFGRSVIDKLKQGLPLTEIMSDYQGTLERENNNDVNKIFGDVLNNETYHVKTLVLAYYKQLSQLPDKSQVGLLIDFVKQLDCYPENRYDEAQNNNVKAFLHRSPDAFCQWKHGAEEQIAINGKNISVIDTDDWKMLLTCGMIPGSCQNIYGDPYLNKCLLGLMLNGDYRMLAITNTLGNIVARSIIQILFDKDNNPVMHMELCYPYNISPDNRQAILACAKNRAKKLGLPLTCNVNMPEGSDDKNITLTRYACTETRSSVYSDSLKNNKDLPIKSSDQEFSINAKLLYVPSYEISAYYGFADNITIGYKTSSSRDMDKKQ